MLVVFQLETRLQVNYQELAELNLNSCTNLHSRSPLSRHAHCGVFRNLVLKHGCGFHYSILFKPGDALNEWMGNHRCGCGFHYSILFKPGGIHLAPYLMVLDCGELSCC